MIGLLLVVPILLSVIGCIHEPRSIEVATTQQRLDLTEEESDHCKQVAWDAVNSTAMLQQFKPDRMTTQPFQFSKNGITCSLDNDAPDTVEVAVPSGHDGLHGCYMAVKVKRNTYEILRMRESIWP